MQTIFLKMCNIAIFCFHENKRSIGNGNKFVEFFFDIRLEYSWIRIRVQNSECWIHNTDMLFRFVRVFSYLADIAYHLEKTDTMFESDKYVGYISVLGSIINLIV